MGRAAFQDLVIGLALFALAFWHFLSYVPLTTFHRDEARWVHRSYFLEEFLDPDADLWREDSVLTLGQPPLGNYLMGLGLLVQGRELKPNGFYDMSKSIAWNRTKGNVPLLPDLHAARRTNAFVGALTVLVVYFIGRRLANRVAGVVGALLLIPHPLNVYLSTFAGSDALLVFFVAAAALVAIALADRPTWPRALLLGLLLGLGGATKLSPLLLSLPLAGLGLALLLHGLPARLRQGAEGAQTAEDGPFSSAVSAPSAASAPLAWMLLTLPAVAFAAFVVAYPYLWPDPLGRTMNLIEFRAEEMDVQGTNWSDRAVGSRLEAVRRVGVTLNAEFSTSGRLMARFARGLGQEWRPAGIDLPFAIVGAEILLAVAIWRGPASRWTLAGTVLGAETAIIVAGMRSDWPRYHLPILMFVAVCIGVLAGQTWAALSRPALHARARSALYAGLDRLVPDTV